MKKKPEKPEKVQITFDPVLKPELKLRYKTLQHKREFFLKIFSENGNVSETCRLMKIQRSDVYHWLEELDTFKNEFNDAQKSSGEALEREARRRATEGTQQGVWHNGKLVGVERKYSDVLLIFLLKGALPDKYRDIDNKLTIDLNLADRIKTARIRIVKRISSTEVKELTDQTGQETGPERPLP